MVTKAVRLKCLFRKNMVASNERINQLKEAFYEDSNVVSTGFTYTG